MRKTLFLFVTLLLGSIAFPALAQRRDFTLEQVAHPEKVGPADLAQLAWVPGTNDFAFVQGEQLLRGSAGTGRQQGLLRLSDLNNALQKAGGSPLSVFPQLRWVSSQQLVLRPENQIFWYDLQTRTASLLHSLPPDAQHLDFHPATRHSGYTAGPAVFVSLQGGEKVKVADQGFIGMEKKATHSSQTVKSPSGWSPSGHLFAFFRTEEKAAGTGSPIRVGAGIFDTRSRQTITLPSDPAWPYLVHLTWSPEERHLYGLRLNPAQNRLQVAQFDATTGTLVKALFEEKSEKYLAPEHGLYFVPNHPQQFVWVSDRDGYDHLYLYDTNGQQIRRLTGGNWSVTDFLGFAPDGKTVFYVSTAESPLERHFYSLNLSNGNTNRISQGTGVHQPLLSPNANYFLNTYSSFVSARQIRILEPSGKIKHTLLNDRDPLQEYRTGEINLFPIKGTDGTDLYCRLITPPGFDRGRRYPVVVYVPENPLEQAVTNSWLGGGELWMQWLAQQGYLVFTLDSRGSGQRGRAFAQAPYGLAGVLEGQDQLEGVDYLRSLDYVDPARIAIWGHGLGGHLAASLLFNAPSSFKAGVAVNPTLTWQPQRTLFPPAAPAKKTEETDLRTYLSDFKGRLLLGLTEGDKASASGALLIQAAEQKRAPVQVFRVPSSPGQAKVSKESLQKIGQFLEENL
ncbi:S9 family peptidase [soil metagenome]